MRHFSTSTLVRDYGALKIKIVIAIEQKKTLFIQKMTRTCGIRKVRNFGKTISPEILKLREDKI